MTSIVRGQDLGALVPKDLPHKVTRAPAISNSPLFDLSRLESHTKEEREREEVVEKQREKKWRDAILPLLSNLSSFYSERLERQIKEEEKRIEMSTRSGTLNSKADPGGRSEAEENEKRVSSELALNFIRYLEDEKDLKVLGHAQHIAFPTLRGDTLLLINNSLNDPILRTDNFNIAAIFFMAWFESFYGCSTEYAIHMCGLARVVEMRGGLGNLALDRLIKRIIAQLDNDHAKTHESRLYFDQ